MRPEFETLPFTYWRDHTKPVTCVQYYLYYRYNSVHCQYLLDGREYYEVLPLITILAQNMESGLQILYGYVPVPTFGL